MYINLKRVIKINSNNINKNILNTIIYHIKDNAYYFIDENILKENLNEILKNPDIILSLTELRLKDDNHANTLFNTDDIVTESYIIEDGTNPEYIIDLLL